MQSRNLTQVKIMKKELSKKFLSTLATGALLLGATVASANTISIVNSNADATPTDILVGTDTGIGNTFSMDINVLLDAGITAGQTVTDITWDPTILSLNSVNITGFGSNASGPALPTNGGSYQINFIDFSSAYSGAFTLATLGFNYIGPGNAAISLNPIFPSLANLNQGWQILGQTTGIAFDTINNATVSAVPVPPAMLLFASAIAGLGVSRRRKV